MLVVVVPVALAQQPAQCEVEYTVQADDWLSKLADRFYGDVLAYPTIVEATNGQADERFANIANPDLIEPGWLLCIPGVDVVAALAAGVGQNAPAGLSPQELANATYPSQYTQSGTVTLENGRFSEPAAPGSATETKVSITPNLAYGEINDQPAAVVVLVSDPGGSGTFYDLHLVVSQNDQPVNVASTFLGDRVQINSVTIENNQIVVDMVQAGPDDPLCCPSQQVVKTYELPGDQLVETSSEVVGGTSGDASLAGTSWLLASLGDQNALPTPAVTANFNEDGSLTGSGGCNSYSFSYELEGNKLTISSVGPVTLMACPDPIMQQEAAYFAALGEVATYQTQGDTLELLAANGNVVATFTALQPASLAGSTWEVIGYNNGKGGVVSVIIGTEITAVFGEDGMLTGSAGCNNYNASYETSGDNNISIGPAATTRKFCADPEGTMDQEQQYLAALQTAATYKIELDRLELRTAEGALAADFARR
jgi:heat shock protein HslJ